MQTRVFLWHMNPDFYAKWAVFIGGGGGLQYIEMSQLPCAQCTRKPLYNFTWSWLGRFQKTLPSTVPLKCSLFNTVPRMEPHILQLVPRSDAGLRMPRPDTETRDGQCWNFHEKHRKKQKKKRPGPKFWTPREYPGKYRGNAGETPKKYRRNASFGHFFGIFRAFLYWYLYCLQRDGQRLFFLLLVSCWPSQRRQF